MTDVAQGAATGADKSHARQQARGHVPGDSSMWFFVIGDLLIFGVYFVGYMYFRGRNHELFLAGQAQLNLDIGAVNTVVLLTSSLFVALGTAAARAGNTSGLRSDASGSGWLLAPRSRCSKCSSGSPKSAAGLTPGKNLFFMYYYVMTGMHLCHVALGLVIICFIIRNLKSCGAARSRSLRRAPPIGTWSTCCGWSCSPCSI